MQGAQGVCQGRCSDGGSSGALRNTFHTLVSGAHRGALSLDRGNGVLIGISGSQAGPVWSGSQPAGRVTAQVYTVGGPPTGSADPESTREG